MSALVREGEGATSRDRRAGGNPLAEVDKMKTIGWNVDTQFDFMRKEGALYVQDAETIEGTLALVTATLDKHGVQVVSTGDWHTPESEELSDTPDYISTFPPHCMIETPGAEHVPATKPKDPYVIDWRDETFDADRVRRTRNVVVYKDAFDAFAGSPHTKEVLAAINPDRVLVYGVATNVCVDHAVRGLLARGKEVYVVKDAIKELPNIAVEPIVNRWRAEGAEFITADTLEAYLR